MSASGTSRKIQTRDEAGRKLVRTVNLAKVFQYSFSRANNSASLRRALIKSAGCDILRVKVSTRGDSDSVHTRNNTPSGNEQQERASSLREQSNEVDKENRYLSGG